MEETDPRLRRKADQNQRTTKRSEEVTFLKIFLFRVKRKAGGQLICGTVAESGKIISDDGTEYPSPSA